MILQQVRRRQIVRWAAPVMWLPKGWELSDVHQSWTKLLHAWASDLHFPLVKWTSIFHWFINLKLYLIKTRKLLVLLFYTNIKFLLKIWASSYLFGLVYSWFCSPQDKHTSKFYSHIGLWKISCTGGQRGIFQLNYFREQDIFARKPII